MPTLADIDARPTAPCTAAIAAARDRAPCHARRATARSRPTDLLEG